jgi:hypothetical protein
MFDTVAIQAALNSRFGLVWAFERRHKNGHNKIENSKRIIIFDAQK